MFEVSEDFGALGWGGGRQGVPAGVFYVIVYVGV